MTAASPALIIGAGPAGLAVAAELQARGVAFELLEADRIGAAWHRHYDRLHLHTPKSTSSLPGLALPATHPRYPSRVQFLNYLESYAARHDLQPRVGEFARHCARDAGGTWRVESSSRRWHARHLVVASGLNRVPRLPEWPGRDAFEGEILHSSRYANGERFRDKDVLVVGFGNSGAEIALDLHEHGARACIALRSPVNVVPREICGVPITTIARASGWLSTAMADRVNGVAVRWTLGDLERLGIPRASAGPLADMGARRRVPVIDVGTIAAIRSGSIAVRPGVAGLERDGAVFVDGRRQPFAAVICATGYRAGLASIFAASEAHGLLDADGCPVPAIASARNAHFCGFAVLPTGALRAIAEEARSIASRIAGALPAGAA